MAKYTTTTAPAKAVVPKKPPANPFALPVQTQQQPVQSIKPAPAPVPVPAAPPAPKPPPAAPPVAPPPKPPPGPTPFQVQQPMYQTGGAPGAQGAFNKAAQNIPPPAGSYQQGQAQASTSGDWSKYGTGGNIAVRADPISTIANDMSQADMDRFKALFPEFNTANKEALDQLRQSVTDINGFGGQAAEDAARAQMNTSVNSQRDAALRSMMAQQSRGGALGEGGDTGVANAAMQAMQQGERGLTQDAFGREAQRQGMLGNARGNLAQSLTGGTQTDYQNMLDQFTSNKELMKELLGAFGEIMPF